MFAITFISYKHCTDAKQRLQNAAAAESRSELSALVDERPNT